MRCEELPDQLRRINRVGRLVQKLREPLATGPGMAAAFDHIVIDRESDRAERIGAKRDAGCRRAHDRILAAVIPRSPKGDRALDRWIGILADRLRPDTAFD